MIGIYFIVAKFLSHNDSVETLEGKIESVFDVFNVVDPEDEEQEEQIVCIHRKRRSARNK
jgi:hypothetical protein